MLKCCRVQCAGRMPNRVNFTYSWITANANTFTAIKLNAQSHTSAHTYGESFQMTAVTLLPPPFMQKFASSTRERECNDSFFPRFHSVCVFSVIFVCSSLKYLIAFVRWWTGFVLHYVIRDPWVVYMASNAWLSVHSKAKQRSNSGHYCSEFVINAHY